MLQILLEIYLVKSFRLPLFLGAALLAFGVVPAAALADSHDTGLGAGLAVETSGYGVSLGYTIGGGQQIRLQTGNYSLSHNFDANGNNYNGTLNLSNVRLEDDIHVAGGPFFVAVGALSNNNKITATANISGSSVTIGGTTYPAPAGSYVNGSVTWTNLNPYLGIGGAPLHGSGFGWDAGVAFAGSAKAVVTTNVPGATAADIESAQNQIQNALNVLNTYPVIGIRYVFGF